MGLHPQGDLYLEILAQRVFGDRPPARSIWVCLHGAWHRRTCRPRLRLHAGTHSLRRIQRSYFRYYERTRTHLALDKDPPQADKYSLQIAMGSWNCPKLVGCTIATNGAPPDLTWAQDPTEFFNRGISRRRAKACLFSRMVRPVFWSLPLLPPEAHGKRSSSNPYWALIDGFPSWMDF